MARDFKTRLSGICTVTGEEYSVIVTADAYWRWATQGTLIQVAFPELNADQREFLMNGYTPAEYKKLFSEEPSE